MGSDHSRKLAAIMFTDIVGYSRMMSANEDHALSLLDIHDGFVTAIIAQHGGTILKRMGDAVFAEFESAIAAVRCGIQIQERLRDHNDSAEAVDQVCIRIGIHLGDVVVRDKDLFGEGINVAARLEPLAKPGGICISDAVYQAVKRQSGIEPVLVGEVELKNIVERHVIYQFPPFYQVASAVGNLTQGAEGGARRPINLVRMDALPAPSGLPSLLALIVVTFAGMLAGALTVGTSGDAWRFIQSDFQDARQVMVRLRNAQSGMEREIWRTFSGESRRELAELAELPGNGTTASNEAKITTILRKQLNHIVTGARSLDPPTDGREGEFAERNRRTIERVFPEQITVQTRERSQMDRIGANLDYRSTQTWIVFTLGLSAMIVMFWLTYRAIRPASNRYVFNDIRNVDEVVEYLIREMGFRAAVREGKMLRFRATLKTVLVWSVLGIAARVDGNSVIVSGPAHFLRRLKASIEALSAAGPSV